MNRRAALPVAALALCAVFPLRADALKLVTYSYEGDTRIGAVTEDEDRLIDLNRAYQALLREQDDPRPEAMAAAIVPPDMLDFLAGEERAMAAAEEAVAFAQNQPEERMREAGILRDLAAIQLQAPIPRPTKITLMGFNYLAHAEEMLEEVPEFPLLFAAYATSVNAPGAPIVIPDGSERADYEAEFGVVIGKRGKNVSMDEAMDYVAGYMIVNDATERAWQQRTSQFLSGKSVDTFKAMGPYLVTRDEIDDPHDLDIKLWVNDELRQDSNTSLQIWNIAEVISYMSEIWTLEPGDVLATGTAPGVGAALEPPVFLEPGDVVRIEIEGLGTLENPIEAGK